MSEFDFSDGFAFDPEHSSDASSDEDPSDRGGDARGSWDYSSSMAQGQQKPIDRALHGLVARTEQRIADIRDQRRSSGKALPVGLGTADGESSSSSSSSSDGESGSDSDSEGEGGAAAAAAAEAAEEAASHTAPASFGKGKKKGKKKGSSSTAGHASSFLELNLSRPLLRAVAAMGFARPTPVQAMVIPAALEGRDVLAQAQTGSGKTAAFLLPALERLLYRPRRIAATRVVVLAPTRELAAQCHQMLEKLSKFTDIRSALAVGGLALRPQEIELLRRPDIVIATPGRLLDILRNSASIHMDETEIVVLDEADRLLDLGFQAEIEEIMSLLPPAGSRQTLLLSATVTAAVESLAKTALHRAELITTQSERASAVADPDSVSLTTVCWTFFPPLHELCTV